MLYSPGMSDCIHDAPLMLGHMYSRLQTFQALGINLRDEYAPTPTVGVPEGEIVVWYEESWRERNKLPISIPEHDTKAYYDHRPPKTGYYRVMLRPDDTHCLTRADQDQALRKIKWEPAALTVALAALITHFRLAERDPLQCALARCRGSFGGGYGPVIGITAGAVRCYSQEQNARREGVYHAAMEYLGC